MDKVSGSIQRVNYPCWFISQIHSTIGSSSFFTNELRRTPVGASKKLFKKKGKLKAILRR
jgi:hypothetical protein